MMERKVSQFPSMAHRTSMSPASSVSILHLKFNVPAILSFQCWNEASGPTDMLFPVPGTLLSSLLHLVFNFQLKVIFSAKLFPIRKISEVPWLWAPLVTVLPIITLGIWYSLICLIALQFSLYNLHEAGGHLSCS